MYGKAQFYMGRYSVAGSGLDCKSSAYSSPGSSPGRPTRAKCSQLNMRILSLRNYIGVRMPKILFRAIT